MAWDLATAKQYLGIPSDDATRDVAIQNAMDRVLATVETLLQRKLLLARELVTLYNVEGSLLLPRYPVTQVFSINGSTNQEWVTHSLTGCIDLCNFSASYEGCVREISIDYEGGFSTLPSDLEGVLWEAFMLVWSSIDPMTGGPSLSGGLTAVQDSSDVKSLTVFDAFKADFNVESGASWSLSGDFSASDRANWGWLVPWSSVLSFYRSERGVGLGMA